MSCINKIKRVGPNTDPSTLHKVPRVSSGERSVQKHSHTSVIQPNTISKRLQPDLQKKEETAVISEDGSGHYLLFSFDSSKGYFKNS